MIEIIISLVIGFIIGIKAFISLIKHNEHDRFYIYYLKRVISVVIILSSPHKLIIAVKDKIYHFKS